MENKKINPEVLTFILALMGVVFGMYAKDLSLSFAFIGTIFIKLLKVLIIPLIMSSIFIAITNLKLTDLKRLGGGALLYYLSTSALACIVGLTLAHLIGFGESNAVFEQMSANGVSEFSASKLILSFFSSNIIHSISAGEIVPIISFTFIIALGTLAVQDEDQKIVRDLANSVQNIIMKIIGWIIRYLAPIGVCSLVASLIAKTDLSVFQGMGNLFLIIGIGLSIHGLITLPLIGFFIGRFNPFQFILQIKEALIVALTTASSAATLPISMRVIKENNNVSEKTSDFVLPIGATLNMDGSALYQGIVILFMGQAAGIYLDISQQFLVFFFVMISSAGTAGIPNGGIMMMGAVMEMLGIPLEYLGIYLLIDRLWDYPITMLNVMGDLFGTRTIDKFLDLDSK